MSREYDASQIQKLTAWEAVRMRPGMYVGDKDESGLHQLIYELLDNSIDEFVHGFCTEITITLHADNSVTIQDNGRGIPTSMIDEENLTAAELIMTKLMLGHKFGNQPYKVPGGLHGVGTDCVNFLSEWLLLS